MVERGRMCEGSRREGEKERRRAGNGGRSGGKRRRGGSTEWMERRNAPDSAADRIDVTTSQEPPVVCHGAAEGEEERYDDGEHQVPEPVGRHAVSRGGGRRGRGASQIEQ
jgi:hypothetical protein